MKQIGNTATIEDLSEESVAVIEFKFCRSFMFGSPNDEAFHGHPLHERGMRPYSVFEIQNSS